MAGVFGAHVIQALKLLTPTELGRLTESLATSKKAKKVQEVSAEGKVSAIAAHGEHGHSEDMLREHVSNVVPIHNEEEEDVETRVSHKKVVGGDIVETYDDDEMEEEDNVYQLRDVPKQTSYQTKSKAESALAGMGIYSKSRIDSERAELERREHDKQPSTSVFILSEKEKIKKSQIRMKGQTAQQVYKKQLSMDINNADDEDLGKSSVVGVLLDKVK